MEKQNRKIAAPWEINSKYAPKDALGNKMVMVHMSEGELEGLDNLQHRPSVNPKTGMRQYPMLALVAEEPQIVELFKKVASEVRESGDFSKSTKDAYKVAKKTSLPYMETDEEEEEPLESLEGAGRYGDTKLAWLPENFIDLLIKAGHGTSVNPETGLLEFWALNKLWRHPKKVFKEVLRVAGTVGGAMLGGPLGAGIGNTLASMATGKSFKNSAISGLKSGIGAYGVQGLGQAFPGIAGKLGGMLPGTVSSPMAGFFSGAPNMLAQGLGAAGTNAAPKVAGHVGQTALGPGAQSAPGGLSGAMGMIGSLAPLAYPVTGLLAHMGEKQKYKQEKAAADKQNERYEKEYNDEIRERDWTPVIKKRYRFNPDFFPATDEDREHGRVGAGSSMMEYAKGGLVKSCTKPVLIKGKGKGQDDKIETSVADGSYISDASATSMLGDGSSSAGAAVLLKLENQIKKKVPKKILDIVSKQVKKRSEQVPVYLSNDEFKFDPVFVNVLPVGLKALGLSTSGRPSNEEGAAILRQMIKNIRKHKSQAGSGLPPKAKHPLEYISLRRA